MAGFLGLLLSFDQAPVAIAGQLLSRPLLLLSGGPDHRQALDPLRRPHTEQLPVIARGQIAAAALGKARQRASACHLRYLNPIPADLGEKLRGFTHVIVPELNLGQLRMIIRARYLIDAKGINKVRGQPFTINELTRAVRAIIEGTTYVDEQESKPPEVDVPAGG